MDKEFTFIKMDKDTKVNYSLDKNMATDDFIIWMEIFMKDNGKMVKKTEKDNNHISMVKSMSVNGNKTSVMEKVCFIQEIN